MNIVINLFIILLLSTNLFASLSQKSAMVYYANQISYPMVGVADYIIVQPSLTNTHTHGFSLYKQKMYAYVSIGEIETTIKEYQKIQKEWVVAKNELWKSDVLDIKNLDYQEFLFKELIEPRIKDGFENFFFDTLDSYHFYSETPEEREANEKALVGFIKEFTKRYPTSKLIVNRGFEVIDEIHSSLEAVLFESYYLGLGGEKLGYKEVDDAAREWLDTHINKIKAYGLDVISVEYLEASKIEDNSEVIQKLEDKGIIPYLANRELNIYGKSSKNAQKREIFTLIDEQRVDRTGSESHRYGALVLEYMGYIQKLHGVENGLPSIDAMRHYAGVTIWLQEEYENPQELIHWVLELSKNGIKVLFMNHFGFKTSSILLSQLGIKIKETFPQQSSVSYQDKMIGFEINPSLSMSTTSYKPKDSKPLLVYKYADATESTLAAITPWGGYAIEKAYMIEIDDNYLWVLNPFELFREVFNLKTLPVPDPTTENGKRLLFTHVDGDGIMNRVEGDSDRFSGEVILEEVLKYYDIPHSISVIGGEINDDGLYPELSQKLTSIARDMYKLDNVEPATHTFTHPFFWSAINEDGTLDKQYRLKVQDYNFSIERELSGSLEDINTNLLSKDKNKRAKTVFWTGDCAPRVNALEHIYKNDLLSINGGDTWITRTKPWFSYIGPLGVERGEYYQVFTGALNENVYTNDWLGPFWGFKKVVQTFEMTNSPRRLKPIDIYYHLYSGSKMASVKALHYVFDWALEQDVMPIFTSEYIPKVMDYYTVSMSNEKDEWLVEGMRDLKTLRLEKENASIDFVNSRSTLGLKHFETHTYLSLDNSTKHFIKLSEEKTYEKSNYLISSNAKLIQHQNLGKTQTYKFKGHVDLELEYHVTKECELSSLPKAKSIKKEGNKISMSFKGVREASFTLTCK